MNKFKHLIITRFMCDNFIKEDTNIEIDNDEWKEMAFRMAKRHIIPTLENQSDLNFTLVFLVSDKISSDDVERIYNLSARLNIDVVCYNNFESYIKSCDEDYLITSRLDYDDHVYLNCVKDIHAVLNNNPDIKIVGLNLGITILDGELEAFIQRREEYEIKKEGFCAPMETLILKKDACKNEYFDIYKLGYHTEAVRNFLAAQGSLMKYPYYTLNDVYEPIDYLGKDFYFIWIRHKYSASYLVHNIIHTSNINVNVSQECLKCIFGYSI